MSTMVCPTCQSIYPEDVAVCPVDATPLEPTRDDRWELASWSAGKVVGGKYNIQGSAGGDECVAVFEARTLALNAPRLIRVLRPPFAEAPGAAAEFTRTGQLLSKVSSANVTAVETVGNAEDGLPYLATEYAVGKTLAEILAEEGALAPQRACVFARQIAAALDGAHRRGLLHLALTPASILILGGPEDEQVKVQGFGAAYVRISRTRDASLGSDLTLRDLLPADPRYAAPEQAAGTPPELLDARADLYALGVILYEMLTGKPPFAASGSGDEAALATANAHLDETVPEITVGFERAEVPEPLAALALLLLEKRPELRPASAHATVEKLTLADSRMASRRAPAARTRPAEVRPAPVRALDEVELPAAEPEFVAPIQHPAPVSPIAAAPARHVPTAEPGSISAARRAVEAAADAEMVGAGRPADETEPPVRPQPSLTPVLFGSITAQQPRSGASLGRWMLVVAAVLVIGAATWFAYREVHKHGPSAGPLTQMTPEEVRRLQEATNKAQSTPPSTPATTEGAQPGTTASQAASNPPPSTPGGAPSTGNPAADAPGSRAANPPATAADPSMPAGNATPKTGANTTQPGSAASSTPGSSPASTPGALLSPDAIAAQVQRALQAGDVFFELGQYDLAIKAYQTPLKFDPTNKDLKARIDRAEKAKKAEEQYLGGQPQ